MYSLESTTRSFNARRYSKPWIARVVFGGDGKPQYNWGRWIGTVDRGDGSDGTLVITCADGDIIAEGQKDNRGNGGYQIWYQVRDGKLVEISGKAEAYKLSKVAA